MKHTFLIATLFLSIVQLGCSGQSKKIKLSEVKFESIFGYPKDSTKVFCLLGSGFFRAPRSNNVDSLIYDWINKHPDAILLPISQLKDDKMVYCWVIDNKDTLNTWLIRNGCYPGGTMVGPKEYKGISEVYISDATYKNFIEKVRTAETFAKESKLGIWIKKDPFE
jgi:hypothetical protein